MIYCNYSRHLSGKGVNEMKNDKMENEEMTSAVFKTLIEMVIIIIESSKDKEEALEKLKSLTIIKN